MEIKYYTYSNLLKMGFTKKLIEEHLHEPLLKDNPHYRMGPKMKLYLAKDVEKFMKTDIFLNYQESRKNRVNAAIKNSSKRREENYRYIDDEISQITVKRVPLDELERLTIEAKVDWILWTRDDFYGFDDLSDETLARWMINYIRHNLTNYDEILDNIKGKFGVEEAYIKYKKILMLKIKEVYPELFIETKEQ